MPYCSSYRPPGTLPRKKRSASLRILVVSQAPESVLYELSDSCNSEQLSQIFWVVLCQYGTLTPFCGFLKYLSIKCLYYQLMLSDHALEKTVAHCKHASHGQNLLRNPGGLYFRVISFGETVVPTILRTLILCLCHFHIDHRQWLAGRIRNLVLCDRGTSSVADPSCAGPPTTLPENCLRSFKGYKSSITLGQLPCWCPW